MFFSSFCKVTRFKETKMENNFSGAGATVSGWGNKKHLGNVGTTKLKLRRYASEATKKSFSDINFSTRASHVTWYLNCDANRRP